MPIPRTTREKLVEKESTPHYSLGGSYFGNLFFAFAINSTATKVVVRSLFSRCVHLVVISAVLSVCDSGLTFDQQALQDQGKLIDL